jgi:hypothetical protein
MAIALGTQNKRQVYLAVGLIAVVVLLAAWETLGSTRHPPSQVLQPATTLKSKSTAKPAKNADWQLMGFHLRIDELARSESVDYSADGKDVFSAATVLPIEPVLAPPRPVEVAPPPLPAPPGPPPMDLKYLGFAESDPGKLNALFMHGDDIYMAKAGDIMFHRFRVGVIQESHAQVTDLTSNNTQNIPIASVAAN